MNKLEKLLIFFKEGHWKKVEDFFQKECKKVLEKKKKSVY